MKKVSKITPEKLRTMYEKRKMSSPKIAKAYRCGPGSIRSLLKKYNITTRTKSEARRLLFNIEVPKTELRKLYSEKNLSSPHIAKIFNCSPGFIRNRLREHGIPIRSVREALPLSNKPRYRRSDFSGNLEEKAYLIGFRIGDLHVTSQNDRASTIFIQTNSTIPEQIQLVRKLFKRYGHIWESKSDKNGVICVRANLNRSFNFLLPKQDSIEPWILENTSYFAAFLAGYSDAEGTFCLCGGNGIFSLRSQDRNILWQIHAELIKLGVLFRPPQLVRRLGTKDMQGTISNKDIWGLWIHRKDALLRLAKLLDPYLKHGRKRKEMEVVKENVLERNRRFPNKKDTRWYKLYLAEGINYVGS